MIDPMRNPAEPTSYAPKPKEDDALARIRKRQIQDLQLGDGAGTQRIEQSTTAIGSDKGKVEAATASYLGADKAGQYVTDMQRALGISGPKSAIEAQRQAAMGQLDRGAYMASLSDAQKLAAQGQATGARSQALSSLRGTELAGQKASLEAQLQSDEAQRMDAYNRELMGLAERQAGAQSQFAQRQAETETDVRLKNEQAQAQRELQRAEMSLRSGESLNASEYQRRMAEYQNALDRVQQANTADVLEIQDKESKRGLAGTIVGGLLGAGAKVATAGIAR